MNRISDIYFVGGFGTVQWVDVADYMNTTPDSIVAVNPQETITVSPTLLCHAHVYTCDYNHIDAACTNACSTCMYQAACA